MIAITSLPFMLIGICIGYAFSSKAAIAVVQVLYFGLAFGGGMFLPPQIFPGVLLALALLLFRRDEGRRFR